MILKVLASSKISSDEKKNYKCLNGYLYNSHKVQLLHKLLPKTSAYVKGYNRQTKWMYFLIKDKGLLEKFNTI